MRLALAGVGSCLVFACALGCAPSEPVDAAHGDVLVLELGSGASLRAALLAMGQDVDPPRLGPGTAADPAQPVEPVTPDTDEPPVDAPEPVADDPVDPVAPAQPEWVTVPLLEGETLIHVARRHLGDGRRFLDLLRWNNWSEADARRLPPGQPIRVRRSELREPR